MDIEQVKYSVRQYMRSQNKDINKLANYADKLNRKNEIMNFVRLLDE